MIALRLLQGLALGGEYGGAAICVAEHAPNGRRGLYTSWIQTTATVGLMLALMVILATRFAYGGGEFTPEGERAFGAEWGGRRIPFAFSGLLLGVSVWIRLKLSESPAFFKIKAEGKTSKAPLTESCGHWKNPKIPTRIRYPSMSLPYHIGNGWFGGFLPAISFSIVAAQGNIYSGLWYPVVIALATFAIGMLFVKETKDSAVYHET